MTGLFKLPPRTTKAGDNLLLEKAKSTQPQTFNIKGAGKSLIDKINIAKGLVESKLGKYADDYILIQEITDLEDYITTAITNNVIAIDTETSGLDPICDTIAGISIYTPNKKAAYVPINHISYITNVRIENQITPEQVAEQLKRLTETDILMFNAKFDIRVIKNQLGVTLIPYWDGYVGARLLNENEPENNLDALNKKYCGEVEDVVVSFSNLFNGIPFPLIPMNTAYLYAARDAKMTYDLCKFQEPFLTFDNEICIERDLQGVANVFRNIEMPLINVVAEMEDTGIDFDFNFAERLSKKYNEKLTEIENKFYLECEKIKSDLDNFRVKAGKANKLNDPINIGSPQQIAILLYDVLKIPPPDKTKPKGTGEEILKKINHPIAEIILEYRGVAKLLTTYIEKMPNIVNAKTKRIHASFNQMGTDTGRFSSSEPNMQNIPSHNKEIRKMFKASNGHYLLSSDYSAQEPRITAHMSNDTKMIQAYKDGKDLYVEIASIAFNLPYDECKEFREDGTKNNAGKERRNTAKAIVLGVCYGKGVPAIAEDLNISVKKAQEIYDKIMYEFPGLKQFMIESETMARELGFVTTIWGRKRRLPNMQLEPYEFTYTTEALKSNFDPLFDGDNTIPTDVPETLKMQYKARLDRTYRRADKERIKQQAKNEGIHIKDNGGFIAEATRQCVNSRIQGSAADQTKIAMILVANDKRLKELGFRLLLSVHDELIGECPKENAKESAEIFAQLMVEAAKDLIVPSKCDIEITECWYGAIE